MKNACSLSMSICCVGLACVALGVCTPASTGAEQSSEDKETSRRGLEWKRQPDIQSRFVDGLLCCVPHLE
ncbi:MAG: hypothetical protein JJ992_20210, partial [Planctomycetes bacterium]|nr:hypothetical protein [Planctomycetota bacterium]